MRVKDKNVLSVCTSIPPRKLQRLWSPCPSRMNACHRNKPSMYHGRRKNFATDKVVKRSNPRTLHQCGKSQSSYWRIKTRKEKKRRNRLGLPSAFKPKHPTTVKWPSYSLLSMCERCVLGMGMIIPLPTPAFCPAYGHRASFSPLTWAHRRAALPADVQILVGGFLFCFFYGHC